MTLIFVLIVASPAIFLALTLSRTRKWPWLAPTFAATAMPLQLAGFSTTCTQGADGTFGSGAILSAPFLAVAIGLTLFAGLRQVPILWSGIAGFSLAVTLLILTRDAWLNSLIYCQPCGEMFEFYQSTPILIAIVLVGYLVLPVLLAACAGWLMYRGWSRGNNRAR